MAEYSSSQDVVFGVTISGRNASMPGIERIAGPTINTIPLRVKFSRSSQSVKDYLGIIQKQSVEMIEHEQIGLREIAKLGSAFEDVVNFQNILVIQDSSNLTALNESALFDNPMTEQEAGFFTHPLVIGCTIQDQGVEIVANYDSKVFSGRQVDRILMQLDLTLNELVQGSKNESKLKDLKRVNAIDEQDIMTWNSGFVAPVTECISERFTRQAQNYPADLAIEAWDEIFTYRQLDTLSTQLANRLSQLGPLEPGTCIPICFEKSAWALVAMLAVIKSGAAFVPLDPTHPTERLHQILQAVKSQVILASKPLKSFCQQFSEVIEVSQSTVDEYALAAKSQQAQSPAIDDLAYVIFTSGSTGVPKGVMIHHQAFCTSIVEHGKVLDFGPSSRVLQFASYTFDVSLAEIFTTLLYGGCVCIPSEADRMNNLAAFISKTRVSWACLPPTMATLVLPDEVPTLQTLAISGESPTKEIIDKWGSSVHLHNLYGPTETTIWCVIAKDIKSSDAPTTIGRAVGSRAWIADPSDYQQLVPIGCSGEMLVEGPILAHGYINNSAQTDSVFVTSPDWATGRRFYRTGDLVRYNPDGSIHYIGRKDTQSKIHGRRLELGEIEYHLRKILSNEWKIFVDIIIRNNRPALAAFLCIWPQLTSCLLYTSDAADEMD